MEDATYNSGQDAPPENDEAKASEYALVSKIITTIKADKKFHEKAFERMRRDMFVATHGREKTYSEFHYKANISGRHVKQKTAALYAKNPKATAKRRESLDFAIWDEDPQSLLMAQQTIMMFQQAMMAAPVAEPAVDEMGAPVPPMEPMIPPEVQEAQALIADFTQGMERRKLIEKTGKTLEILFAQAMREQKPVDFKTGMKQVVRRASTTGVGYVELGFQREMGPRPGLTEQLADARTRLDHLRQLTEEVAEGDIEKDDAEMKELEKSVEALQAEPEIVLREGLVFDFPQSTKVIPDKLCRSLVGFIGARHLTVEQDFMQQEVEELFPDFDPKNGYSGYKPNGEDNKSGSTENIVPDDNDTTAEKFSGMVRVWKYYDKPSGLLYFVADGYKCFLSQPVAPDVFVEDFWPVYALTFNAVENESEVFPPSDVTLLLDMQNEHNRSRQGKREHRMAARPRWGHSKGALTEEDIAKFKTCEPFTNTPFDKDPQTKLEDILEVIPVPGVDPNLYDTNEIFADIQLVGGTQESSYGGVAQATATESAIAANSSASSDGASIDDLDAFLTVIARSGGQILLREMSEEKVLEIVGVGAVWPHMTLSQIAGEVFLEVEAGSTGKPNQAVEIQNWKELLPFLIQIPGIAPVWLARETLRRLDDRMDLTDALVANIPSIVNQNSAQQPGTGDPATDPKEQGGEGGDNGPQPPGQTGTEPAFGSNQV